MCVIITKMARSQVLGICACHRLVDIGEKLILRIAEHGSLSATNHAFSIQHACGLSAAPTTCADVSEEVAQLK